MITRPVGVTEKTLEFQKVTERIANPPFVDSLSGSILLLSSPDFVGHRYLEEKSS